MRINKNRNAVVVSKTDSESKVTVTISIPYDYADTIADIAIGIGLLWSSLSVKEFPYTDGPDNRKYVYSDMNYTARRYLSVIAWGSDSLPLFELESYGDYCLGCIYLKCEDFMQLLDTIIKE